MHKTMKLEADSINPPDLLVMLRILWGGKWMIFGAIAFALLLAVAFRVTADARYVAATTLSVEGLGKQVVEFEDATEKPATDDKFIATEISLLASRELVQRLVQEYSLIDDPEYNPMLEPSFSISSWVKNQLTALAGHNTDSVVSPEVVLAATIDRTMGAVSVFNVPDTFLIQVRVESGSPFKAAALANGLARLYVQMRLESQLEAADQAADWLGQQVSQLKSNLEQSEEQLKAFEAATRAISPEALARQSLQIKELEGRYRETQEKIDLSARRIAVLEQLAQGNTPQDTEALTNDPMLGSVLNNSGSLELDDLAISRLLNQERSQKERQMYLASTLSASISELENQVEHQSGEVVELQQLRREVGANAAVYEYALARLKELAVERGIQQVGIRIVSKAEPPLTPSGPSSSIIAAAAAAMGSVVGIGIVLMRQRMQDVFRTAEDVEKLSGVPVVGQTPRLPAGPLSDVMKHIESDRPSLFSEAIRSIRITILSNQGEHGKVIVLASALPGEGKTTQALALARSLSLVGKKVLVIDADLRRRSLAKYFRHNKSEVGLADVVLFEQPFSKAVVYSDAIGADLLLSEKSRNNAADVFSLNGFQRLLDKAKQAYDCVIVDTPAALAVPDIKLIAPFADMVLIVLQWDRTRRLQFMDAVREIESANTTVSGCILSQIDPKGMSRYGYGDRRGVLAAYRAGYYHDDPKSAGPAWFQGATSWRRKGDGATKSAEVPAREISPA